MLWSWYYIYKMQRNLSKWGEYLLSLWHEDQHKGHRGRSGSGASGISVQRLERWSVEHELKVAAARSGPTHFERGEMMMDFSGFTTKTLYRPDESGWPVDDVLPSFGNFGMFKICEFKTQNQWVSSLVWMERHGAWTDPVCVTLSRKICWPCESSKVDSTPQCSSLFCCDLMTFHLKIIVFPRDLHVIPGQWWCDLYRWSTCCGFTTRPSCSDLSRQDQERRDWRKQLDEALLSDSTTCSPGMAARMEDWYVPFVYPATHLVDLWIYRDLIW